MPWKLGQWKTGWNWLAFIRKHWFTHVQNLNTANTRFNITPFMHTEVPLRKNLKTETVEKLGHLRASYVTPTARVSVHNVQKARLQRAHYLQMLCQSWRKDHLFPRYIGKYSSKCHSAPQPLRTTRCLGVFCCVVRSLSSADSPRVQLPVRAAAPVIGWNRATWQGQPHV